MVTPDNLGRGINILGYDGIWDRIDNSQFTAERFEKIRSAGFRHVRVNLFAMNRFGTNGTLNAAWLSTLDEVIRRARSASLFLVLDVHDFKFCQERVVLCRKNLLLFWNEISRRYKSSSGDLVYDLLNEPGGKLSSAEWNSAATELISAIRANDATVLIAVSPAKSGGMLGLNDLTVPWDARTFATVHYYEPMRFTHQGAPWISSLTTVSGVQWGTTHDRLLLERNFSLIHAWANERRLSIYLGEFGVYDVASSCPRESYLRAIREQAEKYGWSWAAWQFDHDFAVYSSSTESWNENVLSALVGGDPIACN